MNPCTIVSAPWYVPNIVAITQTYGRHIIAHVPIQCELYETKIEDLTLLGRACLTGACLDVLLVTLLGECVRSQRKSLFGRKFFLSRAEGEEHESHIACSESERNPEEASPREVVGSHGLTDERRYKCTNAYPIFNTV